MNVIINSCYGGFGISLFALKLLVERNSKIVEKKEYKSPTDVTKSWDKLHEFEDGYQSRGWGNYLIKDGYEYSLMSGYEDEVRTDKDLIDILEEYGSKKISGEYAELRIIEIPDGIDFIIHEYDGMEHVAEEHRTWY